MTKSSTMPDLFGRATLVLHGHEGLRESVQVLRAISLSLKHEESVSLEYLKGRIRSFVERLRTHFAAEESTGYFGTLAEESLAMRDAIDGLKREHREMTSLLNVLSDFHDIEKRPFEFSEKLDALLDGFTTHEQREHELLQAFFNR